MDENQIRAFWKAELRADPIKPQIRGIIAYDSLSHDLGGFREKIKRGAFRDAVEGKEPVLALWSHDASKPLASTRNGTLRLMDTPGGLKVEMDLDLGVSWAADAYRSVKAGTLSGLSFGFTLPKNGEIWPEPGIREIVRASLKEVSPVTWPAYPSSQVSARNLQHSTSERQVTIMSEKEREEIKRFWQDEVEARDLPETDEFGGFRNNAEFIRAIILAGDQREGGRREIDPRLLRAAGTGLYESVASEGGFLLPENMIANLLTGDDASVLKPLCDNYTISNGLAVSFPLTDETSRVSGSELGGLTSEWLAENKALTYVHPRIRGLHLSLKKLGCVVPVTDELFEGGGGLAERYLANLGRRSLSYSIDRAIYRGNGAGVPLGILNSDATITIDKEAGQSPDTLVSENVVKMFSRLPSASMRRAVWLVHPDIFSQLLTVAVGAAGSVSNLMTFDANGPRLMSRPIIPFEHCSKLGDRGDICVADLQEYVWVDRQIRQNTSMHVLFSADESLFRLIYRCDGQPAWSRPITPAFGTDLISPFITLAERS